MNHINAIRGQLEIWGIDALLITTPHNRRYATGFPSTDGLVLITKNTAYLYVDSRYVEAAGKAVSGSV